MVNRTAFSDKKVQQNHSKTNKNDTNWNFQKH